MECNKWEETGLLYIANELDRTDKNDYDVHLRTCLFCSQEVQTYTSDKKAFFSTEMLSFATTHELDEKILVLCTAPKPTTIGIFSTAWIRRTVLTAIVFALGISAGGYFTYSYYSAKSNAALAKAQTLKAHETYAAAVKTTDTLKLASDSLNKNSTAKEFQKNLRMPSHQGIVPAEGMITVDVKKER